MPALPIQTPSLRLRHFVLADAQRMLELNAEPTTSRWLPSHVYADSAAATAALAYLIACYTAPGDPRCGPYVLGAEHRRTGQLVGHVGFSPFDDEVEVSYAVAESERGRGLGTEALSAACEWAAHTFQLRSVLAVTAADNLASRRLLERTGFAHVKDEVRHFQGANEAVSLYRRPGPEAAAP